MDTALAQAEENLKAVCAHDWLILDRLGEPFTQGRAVFEQVREICLALLDCGGVQALPDHARSGVLDELHNYRIKLDAIARKDFRDEEAPNRAADIRSTAALLWTRAAPFVGYLRSNTERTREGEQRAKAALSDLEKRFKELERSVGNAESERNENMRKNIEASRGWHNEVAQFMETAKAALALKEVDANKSLFSEQAKRHAGVARTWLIAALGALGVTAGVAWYSGHEVTTELEALKALASDPRLVSDVAKRAMDVQLWVIASTAATRLVVLSALASAVVWLARLYRVNRHNAVVNQHRADALGTFETLVAAAGSRVGTSDIVLQHAATAIFAPQPTGYGEGTDPPAIQPQLLEVIRAAKE